MSESDKKPKKDSKVVQDAKDLLNDTRERIKKFLTPKNFITMMIAAGIAVAALLTSALGWANAATDAVGSWLIKLINTVGAIAIGVFFSKALDMTLVLILRGSAHAITVERMIHSFIKYVIAIIVIIAVLILWLGREYIAGVLGGVGVLALVIGFGAQKLIGDVIAGVFMVFEGNITVGDIVTINGWRGTVKEIGIRSTVLVADNGNVKVLTNSVITEFVNLSRNDTVAVVTTYIDYATPVKETERVLSAGLEQIKERIPALVEAPQYKGIEEMGDNGYLIKIICKCAEGARFQVQRDLTREVMLLLQQGNVTIAYPQLDVHTR